MVVLTGDLLDGEFPDDAGAARELSRLKAPEGIFAVSGNHEFYAGIGRFLKLMDASGIPVLANESRTLPSGLQVAGMGVAAQHQIDPLAGGGIQIPGLMGQEHGRPPRIYSR